MSSRYSISTNALEYAAEVAYIVATSPSFDKTESGATAGGKSEDEFEFSFSETGLRHELQTPTASTREARGKGERNAKDGYTPNMEEDERTSDEGRASEGETVKHKPASEETDTVTTPFHGRATSTDMARVTTSLDEASLGEQQKTIVIYGPTNYANRRLVNKLVQSNPSIFSLVVPHTSRKKRQNEINGLDFHFVNRKEMSDQVKKGQFIECVKISSPKPKPRTASRPLTSRGNSTSSASVSGGSAIPLNPWRHVPVIQVPSPLLTPKSRQRVRTTGKSDLYGTSREAMHKARLQGKPCIVLSVTYKGAEQLKKTGCEGVYILLDLGGEESDHEGADAAEREDSLQPDHHITALAMDQAFSELQRLTFQAVSSLPLSPRTKLDVTRDEWENLPTVEMDRGSSEVSSPVSKVRLLTFNDLLVHYQRESIGTMPKKTKKTMLLAKGLRTECDLVLSLSEVSLSDTDTIHIKALQTVYQKLMGSSLNCRRYGPHWQDVGFQGVDPGENLKKVGFFGIMQLISFLDQSQALAVEIFNYSRDGSHKFPFAAVSMNLTEATLNSLHGGYLTKLCKKQDQVFVTLNNYHMAIFYRFFNVWKAQTSSQIAPVIRDVESYAKKHPKVVIADFLAYMQSGKDDHERIAVRKISQSLSNPFTPFERHPGEFEPPTTPATSAPSDDVHIDT